MISETQHEINVALHIAQGMALTVTYCDQTIGALKANPRCKTAFWIGTIFLLAVVKKSAELVRYRLVHHAARKSQELINGR